MLDSQAAEIENGSLFLTHTVDTFAFDMPTPADGWVTTLELNIFGLVVLNLYCVRRVGCRQLHIFTIALGEACHHLRSGFTVINEVTAEMP